MASLRHFKTTLCSLNYPRGKIKAKGNSGQGWGDEGEGGDRNITCEQVYIGSGFCIFHLFGCYMQMVYDTLIMQHRKKVGWGWNASCLQIIKIKYFMTMTLTKFTHVENTVYLAYSLSGNSHCYGHGLGNFAVLIG